MHVAKALSSIFYTTYNELMVAIVHRIAHREDWMLLECATHAYM